MPDAHPQSLNQSAAFPYYCCHGKRKQGEQIVPGADEDAGTWPSGSILRGLFPRSIFAVTLHSQRESKREQLRGAWSPSEELHIFIDLHTWALMPGQMPQPVHNPNSFGDHVFWKPMCYVSECSVWQRDKSGLDKDTSTMCHSFYYVSTSGRQSGEKKAMKSWIHPTNCRSNN